MEEIKKEIYINSSPDPVSLKGTEEIANQMKNSVCKIYNNGNGTGFFTKIPYKSKLLPVLITNSHVIKKEDILNDKIISLSFNNEEVTKKIKLNRNRLIYTNEKLDVTIIEIIENKDNFNNNFLELDDQIINYFKLNNKEDPSYINNIYSNKSIYLVGYPGDNHVVVSYGKPPEIDEVNKSKIKHYCSTEEGSSGSPILLIKNQKLIGIHYGTIKQFGYNNGTLLIYSIIEFANIKNNLLISDCSITEIYENNIINSINNLNINSFSNKNDNTNNIILIDKDIENNKDNENKKDNENYKDNKKYIDKVIDIKIDKSFDEDINDYSNGLFIENNFINLKDGSYSLYLSFKTIKKISELMKNCICKIYYKNKNIGTGFLCKLPTRELIASVPVLITNIHVINNDLLNKDNEQITLITKREQKIIALNNQKKKIIFYEYGITVIEIKESDKIKHFIDFDDNISNNKDDKDNIIKTVYMIQNRDMNNNIHVYTSFGLLKEDISNPSHFSHNCPTLTSSLASPIINLNNHKIIGILQNNTKGYFINIFAFSSTTFKTEDIINYNLYHVGSSNDISNKKFCLNNIDISVKKGFKFIHHNKYPSLNSIIQMLTSIGEVKDLFDPSLSIGEKIKKNYFKRYNNIYILSSYLQKALLETYQIDKENKEISLKEMTIRWVSEFLLKKKKK